MHPSPFWGYPSDAQDPSAPLAPVPAQGSFISGIYVQDPTQVIAWAVHAPPRPIYANGMAVDDDTPVTILTPPGPGPFPDPTFPYFGGGPIGNPTGSSNIQLDGFWLGGNGTSYPVTPPSGASIGEPWPPPAPPTWNGTDSEATYIANCITQMISQGYTQSDAQYACQAAWNAQQPAASEAKQ